MTIRAAEIRSHEKKICVICGAEFFRKKLESRPTFEKRLTCNRTCAGKKRSKDNLEENVKHPKVCANVECGKTFYRRGGAENWEKFEARKTCSVDCGHAIRRKGDWEGRQSEPATSSRIKAKKEEEVGKLPPVTPLARQIPEAPKPTEITVWRPESWGGPYVRKVG